MAAFIGKRRITGQVLNPVQSGITFNRGHPLAPDLLCCVFGQGSTLREATHTRNSALALTDAGNNFRIAESDGGIGRRWFSRANNDGFFDVSNEFVSTTQNYTFEFLATWGTSYPDAAKAVYLSDTQTGRLVIGTDTTFDPNLGFYDGAWTDMGYNPWGKGFQNIVYVLDGDANLAKLYVDGAQVYSGATYTGLNLGGTTKLFHRYSNNSNPYAPTGCTFQYVMAHSRALNADEVHDRWLNPYGVFTVARKFWPALVPSSATGATVSVPVGTLAITGQVPSVSTGVQVSAPAGTLTIQGYVPTIDTGVSVAVPAGSLAITGQVPSISTGVQVSVPVGTLTITGQVPVITAGGVIANVPAGSLAITGQVPTVSTGVSVAVPAGGLTIQGYVPSLSMGVSVAVPAGALAIQGYVPSVSTGVSVAVPVGSLAITGQVPTVTAGAVATTVSVPVGTLTITGYAPLVTSYLRSGLLAQIHTDIDGYLNTYDKLSKIVTHNAVDYRGVFTDVSAIGLQGGTNARDGPWVVMKSDDVDGTISYGDTVTIYSRDWTVEGIQPDGTGTTRLILIPAA